MNIYYDDESIKPLGLSAVEYTHETDVQPPQGSMKGTGFPKGLSVTVANNTSVGYGYILTFNRGCGVYGETQLFIPHNISSSKKVTYQLKIRSCSDDTKYKNGWSPWEPIAYVRDIDTRVNAILKEKGLI